MAGLSEQEQAAVLARLGPLLSCLDTLERVSGWCHPHDLGRLLDATGAPDDALAAALDSAPPLPERLAPLAGLLETLGIGAVSVFAGLREAAAQSGDGAGDPRQAARALRPLPKLLEALYPLSRLIRPVHEFFLDPDLRGGDDVWRRFSGAATGDAAGGAVGVLHLDVEDLGPVSLYVPEAAADAPRPLAIALHGGRGSGEAFLWSWVRAARSRGAIVAAPSALGDTWSITGKDVDEPRLTALAAFIRDTWKVDPSRQLLTGMSDGGTYCYVVGLADDSPFTHLAPVAASFHPMLTAFADPARLQALPIRITHGALDWMFPIEIARTAEETLVAHGAAASLVERDDLAHSYPEEISGALLDWMESD